MRNDRKKHPTPSPRRRPASAATVTARQDGERGSGSARPARAPSAANRRRATQQLRALAHPIRLRLLEAFAQGRRTTMQVAVLIGEPPTRLYHHVNAMERAGILKLVDTRPVRGTTEKYFEIARKQIGIVRGHRLTPAVRGSLTEIATVVLEEARAELLAAIANPAPRSRATAPAVLRMMLTVPPSKLDLVRRRLRDVLKEIRRDAKKASRSPESRQWALTLVFAPTVVRR
jgi:DNA-binding transcriptional ArsR family regulator